MVHRPRMLPRSVAALSALALGALGAAGPARAEDPAFTIDRYGQVVSAQYPGKVTSDDELKADVAADKAYYGSLDPGARDEYGGQPGSGAQHGLDATGWFHIRNKGGRSFLVDPTGNEFFSLGLNGVATVGDTYTQVAGRESTYEQLPKDSSDPLSAGWMAGDTRNYSFYVANQVRKYGSWNPTDAWNRHVERDNALGFNTVGGFSEMPSDGAKMPYLLGIDEKPADTFGSDAFPDVYDPAFAPALQQQVAPRVAGRTSDPYLIGYTFANEIRWDHLRTQITSATVSGGSSTKAAFVALARERHGGDISAFNTAWGTSFASFDELGDATFTPATDEAVADIDAFTAQYLDRYYEVYADAFRAADPHHMVIGDRWLANVMNDSTLRAELATAAGHHLDALTYNYYTWDIDKNRIDEIYKNSGGKPMILTEFHYGETSHGLSFAVRMAGSEKEKGELYRSYVEQAASTGKVVGAHWFEEMDQAATGRWFQGTDGESGGIGIYDVTDRPYKTMLESVTVANKNVYDVADGTTAPYAYDFKPGQKEREGHQHTDIPQAATAPVIDGSLDQSWPQGPELVLDGTALTAGVALDGMGGNFRLAWDDTNLYLHGTVKDPTPMRNRYHGADIWDGDAVELFIGPKNVDQGGSIRVSDSQLIISAAPQDDKGTAEYHWFNNRTDQPAVHAVVTPADGGYQVEAAIPISALGLDAGGINPPRDLRFDLGFDDGNGNSRQRQFMWNGVEGNSSNRDKWGLATLTATASASRFSDVPADSSAYEDIVWMADSGIDAGFSDGTYRPDAPVTREQMAQYLYRAAGSPAVKAPHKQPFTDVAPDSPSYDAVVWVTQKHYLEGTSHRTFSPTREIRRDEAAGALYRAAGSPKTPKPTKAPFTDVPPKSRYAKEISWLKAGGAVPESSDGTFRPSAAASRAEVATFLHRTTA